MYPEGIYLSKPLIVKAKAYGYDTFIKMNGIAASTIDQGEGT